MAYSRFRDRSGLTTRRRVLQYLQRERERMQDHKPNPNPSVSNDTEVFYMMGMPGQAPNRQPSASLI